MERMVLRCLCHVISITVCVLAILETSSGYYSNYDSAITSSQLRSVNEKLDILTNEVSRLADATLASTNSKAPSLDPVTLVAVNRAPGPDGNIFTLHLKKNTEEVFYDIIANGHKIAASSQDEQPDGTYSFTFVCGGNCKTENEVEVLLTNRSHSSGLRLSLTNRGARALFQDRFTVPALEVRHSRDLLYDHNRDVDVTISSSYGEDNGFSDLRCSLTVLDLDTDIFQRRNSYDWIEKLDRKRFLETEENTVQVKTSEYSVSGWLQVAVQFTDSDAPLVTKLKVERSIVLRPRDMEEPFPEDFLEFDDTGERVVDGVRYKTCQAGSSCLIDCSAIGPSNTSVAVTRQLADGAWEPVADATLWDFDYRKVLEWTVQPTTDSEDMTFRCTALTAATNVSQDVKVTIDSLEFYMDQNRSSIEVVTDESRPGHETVTINCTIVGRPVSQADIMMLYGGDGHYYPMRPLENQAPVSVLSHGAESTMTATINFDPTWNRFEYFQGAECRAFGNNRMAHCRLQLYE